MGVPYLSSGLSAAQQYFLLRNANSLGGSGRLSKGVLSWNYEACPNPIGRLYQLVLTYKQGKLPTVMVRSPNLTWLAQGKPLPHVYSEDPVRLCLFLPWTQEWNAQRALIETVIPWSFLWLYYFEGWLRSGEWTGGGLHPNPRAGCTREESLP
jgi:hypothetical protein